MAEMTEETIAELERLRSENDRHFDEFGVPHPEAATLYTRALVGHAEQLIEAARRSLAYEAFLREHGSAIGWLGTFEHASAAVENECHAAAKACAALLERLPK